MLRIPLLRNKFNVIFSLKPLGFAHATALSALLCAIWLRHCQNHACGMTEPQKAPNA
jgi:hypothetical protein